VLYFLAEHVDVLPVVRLKIKWLYPNPPARFGGGLKQRTLISGLPVIY